MDRGVKVYARRSERLISFGAEHVAATMGMDDEASEDRGRCCTYQLLVGSSQA